MTTPPILPPLPLLPLLPLPAADGPLAARLQWCAERVGGKRALAEAAGVSESQLYRYFEADSAIPHDKLLAIAAAAGAAGGWLLTGLGQALAHTSRPRPEFRPALLIEIQEHFDLLLVEYQKHIPLPLRSRMVAYLYDVLRQEETTHNQLTQLNKFRLLQHVSFLAAMQTEAELSVLHEAFHLLQHKTLSVNITDYHQLLNTWSNLLVRGTRGYYNSYAGQVYFDRMGLDLPTEAIQELHHFVNTAMLRLSRKDLTWLDVGCGNGRHLAHLHKHIPNLHLQGLELSDGGVELCHKLEKSERLPLNCVQQGDIYLAPYKAEYFDVVFSRLSLQTLPYFNGLTLGLPTALAEIWRITRPQGLLCLTLPIEGPPDFLFPEFYMQENELLLILKQQGWVIIKAEKTAPPAQPSHTMPQGLKMSEKTLIHIIAQKVPRL